jgi:cytochrome c
MGDQPTPFNKGRLVLVFIGLSAAILIGWLLLRARPAIEEAGAVEPAQPEQPLSFYLARADAARGEAFFGRCAACHTIATGTTEGVGPNLWGAMGSGVAARPSYSYSPALTAFGGRWDWERMNAFLKDPRAAVPGTRMSFAGVVDPQDRADVMLYMNRQGGRLPAPAAAR